MRERGRRGAFEVFCTTISSMVIVTVGDLSVSIFVPVIGKTMLMIGGTVSEVPSNFSAPRDAHAESTAAIGMKIYFWNGM